MLHTPDLDPSEELILFDVLEPQSTQPCPCGRPHPLLYSDDACDAARRRVRIVNEARLDTDRQITERTARQIRERGLHRLS